MQVTADRTTVGNPVESLQFSVAWGDKQCLIGQVGPSTGNPVTEVMPRSRKAACLIGETRSHRLVSARPGLSARAKTGRLGAGLRSRTPAR
ncbi:DUF6993 domain-containing protein [Microbacterium sp.]|uniref:DUF6993 domain-containing protein n=1 Tax=Microbacterium sp. TaxID=51671 RepID=UPI003A9123FA